MPRPAKTSSRSIIEPELLLGAYASGWFPMAESKEGGIRWYSPEARGILPLEKLKISRSLGQTLRKKVFDIRIDTAFEEVMRACAERADTWISEIIIRSYLNLFRLGYAHSVESWSGRTLDGGLYGVALGGAFFGESMFSRKRDASKVALVDLVRRLRERQFQLLDTQFVTPHLLTLGAVEISRDHYLRLLKSAINLDCTFAG
ncbi:MAG TPA: leucyl/phenylalanyl-tRNA--protein transferase [Bacteroidota bacterium]|nr:leucyl/phenylalanyl-tRNA--protein transferase [Bacteroidota bacterium]